MSERVILNQISREIDTLRANIDKVDKSSKSILDHFEDLTSIIRPLNPAFELISRFSNSFKKHTEGAKLVLGQTVDGMYRGMQQHRQEQIIAKKLWQEIDNLRKSGKEFDAAELATAAARRRQAVETVAAARQYRDAVKEVNFNFTGMQQLGVAMIALLDEAFDRTREWNRSLTEGNALMHQRNRILSDISVTQRITGASVTDMAEATRSLVTFGLESKDNFRDNLELVLKLKTGLGLATEQGARLAFIFGDRIKGSFRDIADTLTRVVDSTSLMADEASRYAEQLGRAALFLNQSSRAQVGGRGGSIEFITRLEGAIKDSAGVQGEIASLVADMTSTLEGGLQAAIFGLRPGDLSTGTGAQQLVDRITAQVATAQRARDAGDFTSYQAMLEQIRVLLNDKVSLQTLNSLVDAQRKLHTERQSGLTIEQKWRNEVTHTGKVFEQLRVTFMATIYDGLLPFVNLLRGALGVLNSVLDWMRKIPGLFKALSVSITIIAAVTIPMAIVKFVQLTAALTAAAIAAGRLAVAQGAATAASLGGTGAGAAGLLSRIPAIIATSIGPVFAVLAAGAAGVAIGTLLRKLIPGLDRIHELFAPKKALDLAQIGTERGMANIFAASFREDIRSIINKDGTVAELQELIEIRKRSALATGILGKGSEGVARLHLLTKEAEAAARFLTDVKSGRAQVSAVPDPKQVQEAEENRRQTKILEEQVEIQRKQWANESQRARDEQRKADDDKERVTRELLNRTGSHDYYHMKYGFGPR